MQTRSTNFRTAVYFYMPFPADVFARALRTRQAHSKDHAAPRTRAVLVRARAWLERRRREVPGGQQEQGGRHHAPQWHAVQGASPGRRYRPPDARLTVRVPLRGTFRRQLPRRREVRLLVRPRRPYHVCAQPGAAARPANPAPVVARGPNCIAVWPPV